MKPLFLVYICTVIALSFSTTQLSHDVNHSTAARMSASK